MATSTSEAVLETPAGDPLDLMRVTVDTREERFGSTTTIAHLAQHSFNGMNSNELDIYEVDDILERDWRDEIEGQVELEYLTGVHVTFKDGSKLSIGAWADCCDDKQCRHCIG